MHDALASSSPAPPGASVSEPHAAIENRMHLMDSQRRSSSGACSGGASGGDGDDDAGSEKRGLTLENTHSTDCSASINGDPASNRHRALLVSPLASTPAAADAAAAAVERGPAPMRIGWSASRVGNPAIPALTSNVVARNVTRKKPPAPSTAAAAASVTGRRLVDDTKGGGPSETGEREGKAVKVYSGGDSGGGSLAHGRVPVQLKAMLLYASTCRGIDLRKWFDVASDGGVEDGGECDRGAAGRVRVGTWFVCTSY